MTDSTKQCPACKEQIDFTALRCKFCTQELNKNPVTGRTASQTAAGWITAIGFGIIAFIGYQGWKEIESLGL